jgi:alkylated DNA repair dioxygenase AlkB
MWLFQSSSRTPSGIELEIGPARPNYVSVLRRSLFPVPGPQFARGYAYEEGFLSDAEEAQLLREIEHLPFGAARYKEFIAKRRTVSYGGSYDYSAQRLETKQPIADFLHPLRLRAATWAGCAAEEFTHALITEYAPGVGLGWHRDVPDFELVVGISLLSSCRMRFRRYPPKPREKSLAVELERRSIYRLQDDARWQWQHSVPPVSALRFSITFRTLRK